MKKAILIALPLALSVLGNLYSDNVNFSEEALLAEKGIFPPSPEGDIETPEEPQGSNTTQPGKKNSSKPKGKKSNPPQKGKGSSSNSPKGSTTPTPKSEKDYPFPND